MALIQRFENGSGHQSRRCRAYQQSTLDVLVKACRSWRAIFPGAVLPEFPTPGGSCVSFAKLVKKFLASSVSTEEAAQMGFQSIKKLLPDSCRCMEDGLLSELVASLGRPPRALPRGYLRFVKKTVGRLFPKGWDRSYEGFCLTTSPPLSSVCEGGRRTGGCLGVMVGGQADFLSRVLHGEGPRLCPSYRGKLLVVQSAGKPRPLSKFPAEALFLRPLHKTIYGSLSKRKWLLRGPPTKEALACAGFKAGGGVLVSGDYRSATDNLPIEVMERALEVMLGNAVFVPSNVRELALRACRPILFSEEESLEVRVGQMMGSYLSFPFLCLQNYLAYAWACFSERRPVGPCLINGDDILFQTNVPGFPERWLGIVGSVGLEVEETKTSIESDWGTLNSTLLRYSGGSLVPVWSPRFGMLKRPELPHSLGAMFLDFLRGCPSELRFVAGREWFRWHVGGLRSSSVSLPSLGFRGLLAKRLAKKFGLLAPPGELPRPPLPHGVVFSPDFVSELPASAVDEELALASSVEVCAGKWSAGWSEGSRVAEAIRYCLALSSLRARSRKFDYPLVDPGEVFGPPSRYSDWTGRLLSPGGPSRREVLKSWVAPFEERATVLVVWSVLASLSHDFGRGQLPSYEGSEFDARRGLGLPDCGSGVA